MRRKPTAAHNAAIPMRLLAQPPRFIADCVTGAAFSPHIAVPFCSLKLETAFFQEVHGGGTGDAPPVSPRPSRPPAFCGAAGLQLSLISCGRRVNYVARFVARFRVGGLVGWRLAGRVGGGPACMIGPRGAGRGAASRAWASHRATGFARRPSGDGSEPRRCRPGRDSLQSLLTG